MGDSRKEAGSSHLKELRGGWKAPEAEWPKIQDRLVEAMVQFEATIRKPILSLRI